MAVGSIMLAALSLVFIAFGVLTTPIPIAGAVFSFCAPALALAGIATGGVAMSRAKRTGESASLALAGVISSTLSFVPALLTAITCGVCNALVTAGHVETRRDVNVSVQRNFLPSRGLDAGVRPSPPSAPSAPGNPPPAFPPPPLAPKRAP